MKNLVEIADGLQEVLDDKDEVREIAIKSSRAIIRLSGSAVHRLHKGEDIQEDLHSALNEVDRLRGLLQEHPDLWNSGLVADALQEVSEAAIVDSLVRGRDLPWPDDLGVTAASYLLGLADAIGEVRRLVLKDLQEGDVDRASDHLDTMEEMYLVLMRFDHPQALVPVKRKQDVARSLVEKTRGDVALAMNSARLQKRLDELMERL
ncbi:MAG: translin family protein [Methanomassiliicoccales archaeon]